MSVCVCQDDAHNPWISDRSVSDGVLPHCAHLMRQCSAVSGSLPFCLLSYFYNYLCLNLHLSAVNSYNHTHMTTVLQSVKTDMAVDEIPWWSDSTSVLISDISVVWIPGSVGKCKTRESIAFFSPFADVEFPLGGLLELQWAAAEQCGVFPGLNLCNWAEYKHGCSIQLDEWRFNVIWKTLTINPVVHYDSCTEPSVCVCEGNIVFYVLSPRWRLWA